MDRALALARIEAALEGRTLVWLGKRGEDARPLLSLGEFTACFSIMAPLHSTRVDSICIETLTGLRDEYYDIDVEIKGQAEAFVHRLTAVCTESAVLVGYRPYGLLSTPQASNAASRYRGISRDLSRALDRKPDVELGLTREAGIETVPWTYLPRGPERLPDLRKASRARPIVLRKAKGSGGDGLDLITKSDDLSASAVAADEDEIAWSPFLPDYIPLNLGGCVFDDGGVTLHTPSVQLIGLPQCTRLTFAYCGNDYAAAALLEPAALDSLERMSLNAGRWLWARGYRGAFGLDAMVRGHHVLFTEINPRFQGSSRPSGYLDVRAGLPDIFLDHVAALLGLASYKSPPLRELAQDQPLAHVYSYSYGERVIVPPRLTVPDGVTAFLEPDAGVQVGYRSAMFELEFARRITADGLSIDPAATADLGHALSQVQPVTELAQVDSLAGER